MVNVVLSALVMTSRMGFVKAIFKFNIMYHG